MLSVVFTVLAYSKLTLDIAGVGLPIHMIGKISWVTKKKTIVGLLKVLTPRWFGHKDNLRGVRGRLPLRL